jgi:hypothetical protein
MDLPARSATGAPQHRRSVFTLATVVAVLTVAMAALAPASSFGAEPPSVSSVSPTGGRAFEHQPVGCSPRLR